MDTVIPRCRMDANTRGGCQKEDQKRKCDAEVKQVEALWASS